MSGLSKLQKQILLLALGNRELKVRPDCYGDLDLYSPEILERVYGFPVEERYGWFGKVTTRGDPTRQHFRLAVIGRARYNSAQAAVSRAFRRLQERGLVERQRGAYAAWHGINLTPEGADQAKRLTECHIVQVLTVTAEVA